MVSHLSLGVNLSIISILLILGALFSPPLKSLFDTNYNGSEKSDAILGTEREPSVDFRSLKMCRNFEYKLTMLESVLFSDYDRNCTRGKLPGPRLGKLRTISANANVESDPETITDGNKKSMSIAAHILALMLIGSAVAALVEVLRAHFCAVKAQRPEGPVPQASRSSLGDFAQRRHVRKDTMQAQKSFEIQGLMHRSPLRLLAARPPPLLRRSSFPAQCLITKDLPSSPSAGVVTGRSSRRPSFAVDSEEDFNCVVDSRRRSRLIRRH